MRVFLLLGLVIFRVWLSRREVVGVSVGLIGKVLIDFLKIVDLEAEKPLDDRAIFKSGPDDVSGRTGGSMGLSELREGNQLGKKREVGGEAQMVKAIG